MMGRTRLRLRAASVVGEAALDLTACRWGGWMDIPGLGADFVLNAAVVNPTTFRWGSGVDLSWVGSAFVLGWAARNSTAFNRGWWGGLVFGWMLLLFWVGQS